MRQHRIAVGMALVLTAVIPATLAAEPDWQIHGKWCTTDKGSSGTRYLQTCPNHDQFDSVIACQQDARNGGAVQAIRDAGRDAVNAFMSNYKPMTCQ
jgi:hypothetical protein